jgi:ssDNA-binding Zn-finger/Zn-ribbon topoisomerase 1
MKNLLEQIISTYDLLNESYDEERLLTNINLVINLLESSEEESQINDPALERKLEELLNAQHHLSDFSFLKLDIKAIRSREDAEAIRRSLLEVHEGLRNYPVSKRLRKEIRGIEEQLPELPSQTATASEIARNKRILDAEAFAPECPKCGSEMKLRVGGSHASWGCSSFPKCYGSKRASKKLASYILGESDQKPYVIQRKRSEASSSRKNNTQATELINQYVTLRQKEKEVKEKIDAIKEEVFAEIISDGGSFKNSNYQIRCISRPVYEFSKEYEELKKGLSERRRIEIESGQAELKRYTEFLQVKFLRG